MQAEINPNLGKRAWLARRAEETLAGYGALAGAIAPGCRSGRGGPDLLTREPLRKARLYMAWRANLCLHHCRCAVCGDSFNRGHLVRCLGLHADREPAANQLDQLLNQRRYEDFDALYEEVKALIQGEEEQQL